MSQEKTLHRVAPNAESPVAGDLGPQEPSSTLQQAKGWGGVAREIHDNCQKGVDGEQELKRRANRSGQ